MCFIFRTAVPTRPSTESGFYEPDTDVTSVDTPRKMSSALDTNQKLSNIRETTPSTEEFASYDKTLYISAPSKTASPADNDDTTDDDDVEAAPPVNEMAWRREKSILEMSHGSQKAKRKDGTLVAPNMADSLVDDIEEGQ